MLHTNLSFFVLLLNNSPYPSTSFFIKADSFFRDLLLSCALSAGEVVATIGGNASTGSFAADSLSTLEDVSYQYNKDMVNALSHNKEHKMYFLIIVFHSFTLSNYHSYKIILQSLLISNIAS